MELTRYEMERDAHIRRHLERIATAVETLAAATAWPIRPPAVGAKVPCPDEQHEPGQWEDDYPAVDRVRRCTRCDRVLVRSNPAQMTVQEEAMRGLTPKAGRA